MCSRRPSPDSNGLCAESVKRERRSRRRGRGRGLFNSESTHVNDRRLEGKKEPTRVEVKCPNCGSAAYYRDGFRSIGQQRIQRYLCRGCGTRYSQPIFQVIKTQSLRERKNPQEKN